MTVGVKLIHSFIRQTFIEHMTITRSCSVRGVYSIEQDKHSVYSLEGGRQSYVKMKKRMSVPDRSWNKIEWSKRV